MICLLLEMFRQEKIRPKYRHPIRRHQSRNLERSRIFVSSDLGESVVHDHVDGHAEVQGYRGGNFHYELAFFENIGAHRPVFGAEDVARPLGMNECGQVDSVIGKLDRNRGAIVRNSFEDIVDFEHGDVSICPTRIGGEFSYVYFRRFLSENHHSGGESQCCPEGVTDVHAVVWPIECDDRVTALSERRFSRYVTIELSL